MATLVLGALGASLGGSLLGGFVGAGVGATLGRAAGAFAGNMIDQQLFGTRRHIEGPRLETLTVQASSEGAGVPRVYGRARLAGQVIWAAPFEEVATTDKQGGKAGPRVTTTTYAYYASFAIGLCEGPIAGIGRIFADGQEIDPSLIEMRLYRGDETQEADPLIAAFEGETPAFRGLAYVVFERLALNDFGNRLPQLTFEVMRPVGKLEEGIEAVTLIPGSGEFAYHTSVVRALAAPGTSQALNAMTGRSTADVLMALDTLQALCPNLKRLSIVTSWFGSDLRAGQCRIEPRVDSRDKITPGFDWRSGGVTRSTATLVSQIGDRPAFGGTPSDDSLVALIREAHARGLEVMLHPFIMMDIPAGNDLTDPWSGEAGQAPYPWRGRMTADVAPGRIGSPDGTPAIDAALSAFIGTAVPGDITMTGETVGYQGPSEWSFRRFILHHARLAQAAGGVEGFILGSELRGLTRLNDGSRRHPFVEALKTLAGEVRSLLGPETLLTYGADWSEYATYRPDDGSGDVTFHLDPLWADPAISAVGINWYQPMTDWRHGARSVEAGTAGRLHDVALLRAGISGGENADWYYASDEDRASGFRTPISDTAYGKDFIFASKALAEWWQNVHLDRVGGVEVAAPTQWQPGMKPVIFTEIGIPSVDLATNAPNVFPDPKSSENAIPPFSRGGRDDALQRRALEAHLAHWSEMGSHNPVIGGVAMLEPKNLNFWACDARPFPFFPLLGEAWSDGGNWLEGHWLDGRLGQAPLDGLVAAISADFGATTVDALALEGVVDGYVIDRPMTARSALEPLASLFGFTAKATTNGIRFQPRGSIAPHVLQRASLVPDSNGVLISKVVSEVEALPSALTIGYRDGFRDYREALARSRRLAVGDGTIRHVDTAAMMNEGMAQAAADRLLEDIWNGRVQITLQVPPSGRAIEVGDTMTLEDDPAGLSYEVRRIEDSDRRRIEAVSLRPELFMPKGHDDFLPAFAMPDPLPGPADLLILDLPRLPGSSEGEGDRVAVSANPFRAPLTLYQSAGSEGFEPVLSLAGPATRGVLETALAPGRPFVVDGSASLEVRLHAGTLESISKEALFAGRNAAAIGMPDSGYEIVQFTKAVLIAPSLYRLSGLVRAQLGTEDVMAGGHAAGADFVLLGASVPPLGLGTLADGEGRNVRALWPGLSLDADAVTHISHIAGTRAKMPLAPVHPALARAADGALRLTFIRRSRLDEAGWEDTEIGLGEESERYAISLHDGAQTRRSLEVAEPAWIYTRDEQIADYGAEVSSLDVSIRQIGTGGRPGLVLRTVLAPTATFSAGSA